MQAGSILRNAMAGVCLCLVAACGGDGNFGGSFGEGTSFASRYASARSALEAGKYDRANRIYADLVETAGPNEAAVRLEYAHSLLRGEEYAEASAQARFLAQGSEGADRAAALYVLGTAQDELGRDAAQAGDFPLAKSHFSSARSALTEALKISPEMDSIGSMAGRLKEIELRLKSLG
ncbi:hypothetical protein BXY66_3560 [Shimia isoporae]|uniref:Tetratricopeptide repeat protein n=1 Tax=Shimia isoporae TaxID=647720 RepID=A0A4R1N1M4_9RHOB|nr:hypothetical protein [Shimia isoporae]TCK99856.1 hypothetical protein BXY66_3560 [Shimia isoporae]